jgi:cytochrome P450
MTIDDLSGQILGQRSGQRSGWGDDYDLFDERFVRDPYGVYGALRDECPIAHSEQYGGSWLPTTFDTVYAIAHDVEHFSSRQVSVVPAAPRDPSDAYLGAGVPPITSDPPVHHWARRLILPMFAPRAVERYEPVTRQLCNSLIDGFIARGRADVGTDYAQQIPVRVIASMLGVGTERADEFVGWVRAVLENVQSDPAGRERARRELIDFFREQVALRREHPGDDMITALVQAEVDGQPVPEPHIVGTCNLILIAGIDTTWSAIGSTLWHLAQHPDQRARLLADDDVWPTAVEEFLRAYAPVTMARIVNEDVEVGGCPMKAGDRVLLPFPAANRDPAMFDHPDEVILDRQANRHVAFGAGIHRCAGSNLARIELRVAVQTFLERIPDFELVDPDAVTWAGGQVHGPRVCEVQF